MIDGVLYVTTPLQQHGGARRRDRPGTVAVRWRGLQARPDPVGERLEAARHRLLARRRQAPRVPQQPASHVLPRGRGRPAGSLVRRRRRGLADRRPGAHLGHQARDAELAAGRLSRSGHRRQPGSRSRAAARSDGLRPGVQRADRQARLGLLRDSPVGEGSRRRHVGERIVAEERARERVGADGAGYGSRPALSADLDADAATTMAAGGRAPTCSPNRWSVSTPPPAR